MDSQLDDNYADLLVAYLNDELDAGSRLQVEQWIGLSDENRKLFESLRKAWELAGEAVPPAATVDTEVAWNKLNARITHWEQHQAAQTKIRKLSTSAKWMRIAAVFIPLFAIAFFTLNYFRTPATERLATANQVIDTTLGDGSRIQLNAHSSIEYPGRFRKNERRVSLKGEAYFDVTHQINQPFIITTSLVEIKVLGTSFSVKAQPGSDTIRVIVDEGRVALYTLVKQERPDSMILTAGEQGLYISVFHRFEKSEQVEENELFWHTHTLVFNHTPLDNVVSTISKAYGVRIRLMDKSIASLPLTTTFSSLALGKVLDIIAETLDLKVVYKDQSYEVYARTATK